MLNNYVDGLADEQVRWKETVNELNDDLSVILGNVFIASASISYYGAFTGVYREKMVNLWLEKVKELNIPTSENYSIIKILGNPIEIRDWNAKGLPSDTISVSNGILVTNCRSYPLMIDPQIQANKWIKAREGKNLKVTKMNEHMIKHLEMCIKMGVPMLIEDIAEHLDPMLEPLLLRDFKITNNRRMVKISDDEIEFDPNFRLYFR